MKTSNLVDVTLKFPPSTRKLAGDKLFQNGYKMEKIFLLSFDFFSMSQHYEKQFFFQFSINKICKRTASKRQTAEKKNHKSPKNFFQ